MTEKSIYLSSWALTEPDDIFYFYQPTWLNAWEAHMYERGLYGTRANGWGLKRFGVENDIYAPERIRNPQYMPYLEAMEQVTDSALQQMPTKERMKLMKSRTAFIYADSWGESGPFEKISSALHIATIDTLPKNLLKKFSITEPTCKIRGEKQAFVRRCVWRRIISPGMYSITWLFALPIGQFRYWYSLKRMWVNRLSVYSPVALMR